MTIGKDIIRFSLTLIFTAGLCLSSFASNVTNEADNNQLKELSVKDPSIKITKSGLEILNFDDENIEIAVYALTGKLVKQVTVPSGTSTIELSPGFYIVKCGSLTKRVAIK